MYNLYIYICTFCTAQTSFALFYAFPILDIHIVGKQRYYIVLYTKFDKIHGKHVHILHCTVENVTLHCAVLFEHLLLSEKGTK